MIRTKFICAMFLVAFVTPAMAQTGPGAASIGDILNAPLSARMIQLILALTVLSVAPGILIMVTCFTRIIIVFSFLRTSIGLQSAPGNMVLISLALFMTYFIMGPTFDRAWNDGVRPLMENRLSEREAIELTSKPFREFMRRHVRDKDLALMAELDRAGGGSTDASQPSFRVLAPAFMISELRRGFEIGFLIAIPFLVIDLIVSTIVMSMGMMMLPPAVVSLPIKVLFFVLIDGWSLLVGSLIRSYG
ncbi:MAG: flagellar type III secretion system pore protein FliP [Hyphomicrobiales bacterium]|nr:flagellar type III secretion system pore protein FliP [Hyphomicrobiales bacterium]